MNRLFHRAYDYDVVKLVEAIVAKENQLLNAAGVTDREFHKSDLVGLLDLPPSAMNHCNPVGTRQPQYPPWGHKVWNRAVEILSDWEIIGCLRSPQVQAEAKNALTTLATKQNLLYNGAHSQLGEPDANLSPDRLGRMGQRRRRLRGQQYAHHRLRD